MRYLNLFFMAMLVSVGFAEANESETLGNIAKEKWTSEKPLTEQAGQSPKNVTIEKNREDYKKAGAGMGNECW